MWYLTRIFAQLKIIGAHLLTIGRILWSYARTHRITASIAAVILIASVGTLLYLTASPAADLPPVNPEVSLIRVGDVSEQGTVTLLGEVHSTSEALVAPDTSGTVAGVYRMLGDFVEAGAIIAELKNDGQRAAVAQARAALEKTKSGASVGGIGVENAKSSLSAAVDSARISIDSAYASMDNAVRKVADEVFSNPESAQPRFIVSTSNSQLVLTAESSRVSVQPILLRHETVSSPGTVDDILKELSTLSQEASTVRDLLSGVVLALNNAIPTGGVTAATISGFRADANMSLSAVNALRTSFSSTIESLKAKRAAVTIAEESLSQGSTGQTADVTGAEANVSAAIANLEKTIIRAPISGTINRLDIDVGSFVSASVPLVYISNKRGLEATVFVSERDIRDVAIGAKAVVSGIVEGKVVRVAQALDPITKKAEVKIALPSDAPLVSGQSASIEISRAKKLEQNVTAFTIPIAAVKITPDGAVVFTVENGALQEHALSLGALQGSTVEVSSGLTPDMEIVSDARGLKTGQTVTLK